MQGLCFCGAVKLTKNFDPNKFGYSVYRIGFDAHSQFSLLTGKCGRNRKNAISIVVILVAIETKHPYK